MDKKPALEARLLYSQPSEPLKRLRYFLFLGFLGAALFFLFSGGALSGLREKGLFQWRTGLLFLLLSFLNLITFPLWLGKIRSPKTFYLISVYLRLPMFAIILSAGISLAKILLPAGSACWIILGLIGGLFVLPLMIKRKMIWVEKSLISGHIKKCFNEKDWTWDASHDMDHIRKDPKKMRPGFIWRMLFWIGPAIGMSLANVFGELNALLIVSLLAIMTGYSAILSIFTHSLTISLVIFRLEKERGEMIQLELEE